MLFDNFQNVQTAMSDGCALTAETERNGGISTWNYEKTLVQIKTLQESKYFRNQFIFHTTPCLLKSVGELGR